METYERKYLARTSGQGVHIPTVAQPVLDTGVAGVGRSIDDFMKVAGPIVAREYAANETARVDDALMKARGKMKLWTEEYKQAAQGNLVDPQDFTRKWEEIQKETLEEFGGNSNEAFRGLLEQKLSHTGINVAAEGAGFAARQQELFRASQAEAQTDEFFRNAAAHPDDVDAMIAEREELKGSLAAKNPGKDLTKEFNAIDEKGFVAMAEGLLARGDAAGVRRLLANPKALTGGSVPLGEVTKRFESARDGVLSIGYDSNGGTSYGTWQLSSKQGSFEEWRKGYLAKAGEQGRAYAQRLAEAGPTNTGTTSGRAVQVYKDIARENPQIIRETQRAYVIDRHLKPMLKSLPAELREMVEKDDGLMQMAFSTVAQHGGAGGASVFRKAWRKGMSADDLITAVYQERARPERFSSSSPEVQRAVANRMPEEAQAIRAYRGRRHVVDPKIQATLLARAEALERQQQATNQDELRNSVANYITASEQGHVLDIPVSEAQLKQAFGDFQGSQMWSAVRESRELALDLNMLGNMTPVARANLLQERSPDPLSPTYRQDLARHEKLGQAVAILEKKFNADCAGTILELDQGARDARQAFLANMTPETGRKYIATMRGAQAARGVSGNLFSRQDAEALANVFEQSEDPTTFAQQLQKAAGRDFMEVADSISPKLSPLMRVVASGVDRDTGRMLVAAARDKDFDKKGKELLRLRGTYATEFDKQVREAFGAFQQTWTSGMNTELPLALQHAVSSLALSHMLKAGPAISQKEAIDKAFNAVVGSRYGILEHRPFFGRKMPPLRVPKQLWPGGPDLEPSDVKKSLSLLLHNIDLDLHNILHEDHPDLDPSMQKEALQKVIATRGWWVNAGNDREVELFLNGKAVRTRSGRPVTFTWQQVLEAGAGLNRKAAQERNLAGQGGMGEAEFGR